MLWRLALQALSTGSKEMRDMRDNLHKHLYGITEKIARWKTCLSQLTGSLSMALSSLYIKHHFNRTLKEKVCLFESYYHLKRLIITTNLMTISTESPQKWLSI